LLFGQDPDSAEASAGGPAVDYVYGSGFTMPVASGSVTLSLLGASYSKGAWTTAGTQGTALTFDPPRGPVLYASGVSTAVTCPATATYGANGQKGTPRTSSPFCVPFGWVQYPVTCAFNPIALTGHPIAGLISTGDNSVSAVDVGVDFTASGGRPVTIGGVTYGTSAKPLQVDSNGYVNLTDATSNNTRNTAPSATYTPRGVLAIFWDDLAGNAVNPANPSGVYWQQFDPDGVPASGDEYTLISWENWKRYTTVTSYSISLNFQIRINEGTGDVEFHYGPMNSSYVYYGNGYYATVWLQSLDGKYASWLAYNNTITISSNTAYRFHYVTP
jgi:hypothetical protein